MNEQALQGLIKQQVLEAGKLVGLTPTDKSVFLTELAHLGASGKVTKKASAMARELGMCRQNYWRAQKRLAKHGLDWVTLLQGIADVITHDYTLGDDGHSGQNVISHDYKPAPDGGNVISHDYKMPPEDKRAIPHDYKTTAEPRNVISHDYKPDTPLPDSGQNVISHDYKSKASTPSEGGNVISHDYKMPSETKSVISHDYKKGEEGEVYSPESTDGRLDGENVVSHDYKPGKTGGMGTNIYYIYNNNILDNQNKSRESLRACGCACAREGLSTPPDVISTEPTIRMPSKDAGDSRLIAPPPSVSTPSKTPSTEEGEIHEEVKATTPAKTPSMTPPSQTPSMMTTPSKEERLPQPETQPSAPSMMTPSTSTPSKPENGIAPFAPPSEERVMAECARQGIPEEEARKFYLFNEQCGWRDGRGRFILNWRAALGLWVMRGVERLSAMRPGGSGARGTLAGAGAGGSSSATLEMRVGIDVD